MSVSGDQQAIAKLETIFLAQQTAHRQNPYSSLQTRLDLLGRIPAMMMANAKRIAEALNSDYCQHPALTSYMFDVLNVVARAQYVTDVLPTWMARDERPLNTDIYGSSKAYIEYQAKGVIGNMPAWNFPVDLSMGPLCEMLAAGNRVIIKPSEQTPAIGELLAEMISDNFDAEQVAVVNGGIGLARHFSTLCWDHLLYTGNTAIGREVMVNAAQNLVPVTLELGGKNPTVFTNEAVTQENVDRMLGIKLTKNGQLCITVDHCYVPSDQLEAFIEKVDAYITQRTGDYTQSALNCAVINPRQFDRLQRYVDEAKASTATRVIELGSAAARGNGSTLPCRMPFTLVVNPEQGSLLDQNEVFGPVLPILTYEHFEEVEQKIQAAERPLGIYIFSNEPALIERLQRKTTSGGFVANGAALQGAQENLGFGGIGKSGMGRHHGIEGFREFSNPRGCVEVADDANLTPLMSPHDEATRQLVSAVTGGMLD